MRQKFTLKTLSLCFLLGLSLTGCRDFGDVRKLSENAETIEVKSREMADDYYESCRRSAQVPADRFPAIVQTREAADQLCYERDRLRGKAIANANQVLVLYLTSLSTLADNRSSAISDQNRQAVDSSIDDLSAALTEANAQLPDPITAFLSGAGGILNQIFDAMAEDIRGDTIPPVMVCTDDAIYGYTGGLMALATDAYGAQLDIEADLYRDYFSFLTQRLSPDETWMPSEALSAFQLEREYNTRLDHIRNKKEFAQAFADVLGQTRETHRQISLVFAEKFELTQYDAEQKEHQIIAAKRDEFCTDYAERRYQEPLSVQITPAEADKIAAILKTYETTTAPLLQKMKQVDFNP